MKPTTGELSLFTKMIDGVLKGIIGPYVVDIITDGDKEFEVQSTITRRKFKSSSRNYADSTLAGIQISKVDTAFIMSQSMYA